MWHATSQKDTPGPPSPLGGLKLHHPHPKKKISNDLVSTISVKTSTFGEHFRFFRQL